MLQIRFPSGLNFDMKVLLPEGKKDPGVVGIELLVPPSASMVLSFNILTVLKRVIPLEPKNVEKRSTV
ncbi:MAG TPA: hypothetical protein P5248_05560, partial [Bacteroidales bacterium]|nr:hypothetical protein [Bacteroidales bacterium]